MPGKLIAILLFIALSIGSVNGQTKLFTIKVAGLKIGNLFANHIKNQGFDYYVTNSMVEFFCLKKIKIHIKTESLFSNGILLRATVKSTINGKDYSSRTIWKNGHYDIDCNTYNNYSYKDTTLTKPIKWSAGKLYFEIPAPGDEVYTESYGKLGTVTEIARHTLKMASPKSKQVYYYSENAKLLKIEVVTSIKNFEMFPTDSIK